ncbi:MAG: hypothetical protein ACRDPS_09560 [Nocardioides sp.]|uniref:hypothetical protein n=1 Tax=Nocardioides sp. TaxID=35761 RepID=UPI003D6A9131
MSVKISHAVVTSVRGSVDKGRDAIEGTASSAPKSVDAGEMSAMMNGMLSKITDSAATVSDLLAVVGDRVDDAARNFWTVDAEAAAEGSRQKGSM